MPFDDRFPKGSEWRKWDLHVHSPATVFNNQFEGADDPARWTNYFHKLSSLTDVAVLGVTDYFSVQGFNRVKEHKVAGNLGNISLLLPNVELRILPVTAIETPINLHVLFSDEIVGDLESKFFGALEFRFQDDTFRCIEDDLVKLGRKYSDNTGLAADVAYKVGVEQFKTDLTQLRGIFEKNKTIREGAIVLVSNSNRDGNSGIQHSSLAATRQEIYRFADAIFSGNPNDREYFLGKGVDDEKEIIRKYRSLKPCVHGSDAHSLEKVCNPDLQRFTWIKADPTFCGLKQILFEPDERVRIQEKNPDTDFSRPFFSRLKISAQPVFAEPSVSFRDVDIPLNRSLIALIGGRGTGKSLLLDGVFKTFSKAKKDERIDAISLQRSFDVYYSKEEGFEPTKYELNAENILSYLHVTQGEVKAIVHPPENLYQHIFSILGMDTEASYKLVDERITSILSQMAGIKRWLEYTDSEGNRTNSRQYNEKKKGESEQLIATLTTSKNQGLIQEYRTNKSSLGENERRQGDLQSLKLELTEFAAEVNERIRTLNGELGLAIAEVDFETQLRVIENGLTTLQTTQTQLQNKNNEIEQSFRTQGIEGDVTTLLEKVNYHSSEIQRIDLILIEIKQKEDDYAKLLLARNGFGYELVGAMKRQRDGLIKNWKELQKGKEGWSSEQKGLVNRLLAEITVKAVVQFDEGSFIDGLYNLLNGYKFRETSTRKARERVSDNFRIHSWWDFVKFIRNKRVFHDDSGAPFTLDGLLTSEFIPYNQIENVLSYLYESRERSKYLRIVPIVKYKGKSPEQLSVGQRGTLFVSLKLATDAFMTPFVFDQPEDDLDNEFIMTDLVPIFKQIKKYRQVIIVTHNANLVVNADAEQVIVADNEDEKIRYVSGSLENTASREEANPDRLLKQGIREHVYQILEGGKAAFEKREQKYGFR